MNRVNNELEREFFNERLKRLYRASVFSQATLAIKMGVSRSSVQRWCDGKDKPGIDRLSDLARALHVSIDYLLTGRETTRYAVLLNALRQTERSLDPRILALLEQ